MAVRCKLSSMPDDLFVAVDPLLTDRDQALDFLIAQFREQHNYALLFEARLMKKRGELGLPLIQTDTAIPPDKRDEYERTMMDAARETGQLFLSAGNIERAWPYFRAL